MYRRDGDLPAQHSAQPLTGFAGGEVIGAAGNQHPLHPVAEGKPQQQPGSPQRIVPATIAHLDLIADVAGIPDILPLPHPQIAPAHDRTVGHHLEVVGGDIAPARVGGGHFHQLQVKLLISKISVPLRGV